MLQWMGGSRRKVATSRKSTQKRQKQHFEQRKRQQQQTAGQEGYSENTATCSPHQVNNRSLDILSLLNISTIGQEGHPSYTSARGNSEGDLLTLNYGNKSCPTTAQMETAEVYPSAPTELKDRRTSSSYQGEKVCPRKISYDSSASHTKALNENSVKVDKLKTATYQSLSVLDLLGDDVQDSNSDGSLMQESHVAFSVEGLGKVEMETPVHSPRKPGRTFNYGCASPVRPTKRVHSSKNLDCWMDDFEPEVDLATSTYETGLLDLRYKVSDDLLCEVDTRFHESPPELPIFPRSMIEPFCESKHKLRSDNDFLHLNHSSNHTRSYFDNEDILHNYEDEDEYGWQARHSFLDENFLDEESDLSWKNWQCDLDSTTAGNLNISNWEKPNFSFEGFQMQRRRPSPKAARRFNISDSYGSYIKQNTSETYCDFIAPEKSWCPTVGRAFNVRDVRSPTAGRTFRVRDVTKQPALSSFMTDDARDTRSLLSEESCSSSAVWGGATKNSPHNAMSRQKMRAHADECISPVINMSLKSDIFARENGKSRDSPHISARKHGKIRDSPHISAKEHGKIGDSPQQQDNINGIEKSSRMSNSSTSLPAHKSNTNSQENVAEEEEAQ